MKHADALDICQCVMPKTELAPWTVPAKLGLLLTDDIDFSLRRVLLLVTCMLLPIRMSRSVSSCTVLSSVAMPLASTQTGTADNAPPVNQCMHGVHVFDIHSARSRVQSTSLCKFSKL